MSTFSGNAELVRDYFRWRNEDARRNALNAHCYLGVAQMPRRHRIGCCGFLSQKRGIGLYWADYDKQATNPKTGEAVTTTRRRIKRDFELPMREEYGAFILSLVST